MLFYKDFCDLVSKAFDLPEDIYTGAVGIALSDKGLELSGDGVTISYLFLGDNFDRLPAEEKYLLYIKYLEKSFDGAIETGSLCIDDTFFSAKDSFLEGKAVFKHTNYSRRLKMLTFREFCLAVSNTSFFEADALKNKNIYVSDSGLFLGDEGEFFPKIDAKDIGKSFSKKSSAKKKDLYITYVHSFIFFTRL